MLSFVDKRSVLYLNSTNTIAKERWSILYDGDSSYESLYEIVDDRIVSLRSYKLFSIDRHCFQAHSVVSNRSPNTRPLPLRTIHDLPLGTRHTTFATCSFRTMRRNMTSVICHSKRPKMTDSTQYQYPLLQKINGQGNEIPNLCTLHNPSYFRNPRNVHMVRAKQHFPFVCTLLSRVLFFLVREA